MTKEEREKAETRVKAILKSNGITMSVGGCGCCESPWVTFKFHGETIVDNEGQFNFDTEAGESDDR